MIEYHEDWQEIPYKDFIDYYLLQNGHKKSPDFIETGGKLKAEINHGRWIVNCPADDCGGAMIVSSLTPYFMCPYCANIINKGKWFNVNFPQDKKGIETILEKRLKKNRNWLPGETLEDLIKENRDRGIK